MDIKNSDLLIESKSLRESVIDRVDVLDKVKKLVTLPGDVNITVDMSSNYYEVGIEAIQSLIKDNRKELESDGLRVITGSELMSYKDIGLIPKNAARLIVFPRRAMLKMGMLLQNSEVAKSVRTYLLDAEEKNNSNIIQIPTELNLLGQISTAINQSYKAMLQIQEQVTATNKKADEANKKAEEANERNKQLESELEDVRRGLVDVNIPLRGQFNEAVRKYAGKNKIEFEDAYNHVYKIINEQYHVNIKTRVKHRQANGEKVKAIDVLEELNLLVPAIRIAKTLAGVAS